MARDRARRVRALVQDLCARHSGVHFKLVYEQGTEWRLSWLDGPTIAEVHQDAEARDLDGAVLLCRRQYSPLAWAAGAIRLAELGDLAPDRRWTDVHIQVETSLREVSHPDRVEGPERGLAEYLLDQAQHETGHDPRMAPELMCQLLTDRGMGWLLTGLLAEHPDRAAEWMPPDRVLTARYAQAAGRDAATAWRHQGQAMPVRQVVALALADPDLGATGALAVLTLLKGLRAEQERIEAEAAVLARRAGATWTQIGAALGVTKQSAARWAANRTAGVPTRASKASA